MRHLVRGHSLNPIDGRMLVFERFFETFEEALAFASSESYHHFKIFDHENQLVHSGTSVQENTYA